MQKGLEKQLFDWKNWDELSVLDIQFYNVTLNVKIGNFEPGTKFSVATILGSTSKLELYDGYESFVFDLKLTV